MVNEGTKPAQSWRTVHEHTGGDCTDPNTGRCLGLMNYLSPCGRPRGRGKNKGLHGGRHKDTEKEESRTKQTKSCHRGGALVRGKKKGGTSKL